ncbi:XrtA/PEP-CTERM system TPR-repeat protein PrsT [Propionivibrio limicola]|uniref:XrtA/PEP-CTERM system TPR-repeat protein PrsT n=1 Tax=Propionivibrio limicola TaxID=167645 RepID=UPI001478236B|nr:XrtA/PEP-CTERM system TPR-repeat protein PrsT [Propionivibrio limicola]
MTTPQSKPRMVLSALLSSLFLFACSGEKPEAMLASAKDYMAKSDHKAAVIQLKNALQSDPNLPEARFLLGKTLLESGNPTAAEVELRKAADLNYPADQLTPLVARTQLMLGQAQKVTDSYASVVLTAPEGNAELQTVVGQAYLAQGKGDAAKAAFEAALKAVPDYGPAIVGQAKLKAASRDLPEALAMVDAVLAKVPRLHEAWQLKGDILNAQGKEADAINAYRKALEAKPDYFPALSAIVAVHMESRNLEAAGKQLEEMNRVAPGHPQTTYLNASLAYQQKNYEVAKENIQQHLKIVPDSPLGIQLAGAIEFELKSYVTAETYLLSALPKTPELGMARRILIATYLRSNQPDKALGVLRPVLDKIENNSDMLALAGDVFMQNGEAEKASGYFEKAARLDPENKTKRTSVALSHLAKGETETAYRELEQIAAGDSGIAADMALIASQLKQRKFDQALKSIANLEKKQPDSPLPHSLRATALLGKDDVAGARKSFEQALVKNPAYYPAAANLARFDLRDKKPEEAKKRFEGVLAKDPKNAQALLALAELKMREGGKTDEVAGLISKAITANPTEPVPHVALIGLYLSAKDTKKAVAAAQQALATLPERPEILDAAGRAQQAAGDYDLALVHYGKLAALMPNAAQPHVKMAEVYLLQKNKDAAMQSLKKALTVKPDYVPAQRGIIMLDFDAGRTNEALARAREVQKQRPKEAVGYVLEGDLHALKKAWPDATASYRKGLGQRAEVAVAIKLHAALMAGGNAGNAAEAEKFADGWTKDHPRDLQFRAYLAESAMARKDFINASKHFQAMVAAQPNNPAVLNNLAWVSLQLKDPKGIEYAERAYKLMPDNPNILDTLGAYLVANGETGRGLDLLKKASGLAPNNAAIRLNLAKALIKSGKKEEARKELDELAKLGDKFAAQAEVGQLLKGL